MKTLLKTALAASLLFLSVLPAGPAHAQRTDVDVTVDSTRSLIDYTGSAVAHDWTGTGRVVTGRLQLDLATPDSSRVDLQAPVASFDSGNSRRDRKMRQVTEAETHPMVRFQSTEIRPEQWGRSSDGYAGIWQATGNLTFHGRTHPVDAVVEVRVTPDSAYARAQFPVSLTRFDVERPELLWVPIADTIRIDARIVGAR